MPTPHTAGVLVDELLRRVRDPQATGLSREQALFVLSHAQRVTNAALAQVLSKETITLEPRRLIYQVSELPFGEHCVRPVAVKAGSTTIPPCPWRSLGQTNRRWFRAVGMPRLWSMIGRDLLVIYPAHGRRLDVEITFVKLTDMLINEDQTPELPDETYTVILDLAEGWVQIRNRLFSSAYAALGRAYGRLGIKRPSAPGSPVENPGAAPESAIALEGAPSGDES